MKERVFVGYIALAQAVIDQANNDVASANRTSNSTNWKVVAADAKHFLKSDWCNYLQSMIHMWHHRNDKIVSNPQRLLFEP